MQIDVRLPIDGFGSGQSAARCRSHGALPGAAAGHPAALEEQRQRRDGGGGGRTAETTREPHGL